MRRARTATVIVAFALGTFGVPTHATSAPGMRAAEPVIRARLARPGSTVIDVPLPFRANLIGVSFRGDRLARGIEVDARARTAEGWSEWAHLRIDPNEGADAGAEPRARPRVVTSPLWVGTADRLEVRVERERGAREIRDLRVHAYNTLGDAVAEPGPLRWAKALWHALGARATAPAEADPGMPGIITRKEWGADESLRSDDGPGVADELKMAFVHHTAGSNDYTRDESAAIVRGIYAYHTKGRGYSDIGYNFLVDRYGQVFEGRAGSIFEPVIGGHVGGMNTYTTGISLMGEFTNVTPPSAMRAALVGLLAWKLDYHHVPPKGTVAMTAAEGSTLYDAGQTVKLNRISGHRDGGSTACPGQRTYDRLRAIRDDVEERGNPKIYLPSARPAVVRPDGDGVADTTTFRATFSRIVDWTLTVRDPDGATVATFRGTGRSLERTWGFMRAGIALGAGRYEWTIAARGASSGHPARAATGVVDVLTPVPRGCACAAGDFNGDGSDDLAIGAPRADVGDVREAGSINVLYGSLTEGLTAAGDDLWHLDVAEIAGVAGEGDALGHALASGDFNGDTFDDLAIGAPGADLSGVRDVGAVHVLYGSADGLAATGDERWREGANGMPGAQSARDRFGAALASGDFNGDGRDDLAVGVPGQDLSGARDAGAIVLLRGVTGGLEPVGSLAQGSKGVRGAAERGDAFGASLATGNFDADAFDDLAVGAPGESTPTVALTGTVHVLSGSLSGIQTADDVAFNQYSVRAVHPEGNEPGDAFGFALAAGDLDGDTDDDLAIGVPGEDGPARDTGAVAVLEGGPDGARATGASWFDQDTAGVPDDGELGDAFGAVLAIAALDAGAFEDLVVGMPTEDVGEAGDAGAFVVLSGSATGPSPAGTLWSEASTGVAGTPERGDLFGYALSPGDFDGDLSVDLAVGIPGQDVSDATDAGLTHVLYGTAAGLAAEGQQRWHRGSSGVLGLVAERDLLGFA